jgi:hypothetical protein
MEQEMYKYAIGQRVKIKRYNPWIGDYEVWATIIGYDNVFINACPTYAVKTHQDTYHEVCENELVLVDNKKDKDQ